MGMSSYTMSNNMANANQCLQQQAAAYSFMHPPTHASIAGRNPYDHIGLGYSRHSTCPSAAQMHAMQSVNGQFGNNSTSSTGKSWTPPESPPTSTANNHWLTGSSSKLYTGLISPGVSVPVQVPGQTSNDLSNAMTAASNYWSRIQ